MDQVTDGRMPLFLQNFCTALGQPRVILPDVSERAAVPLLTVLTSFFSVLQSALAAVPADVYLRFGISFESYFQHQPSADQSRTVSDREFSHYMHILCSKNLLREEWFQVQKEGQINGIFLHDLAETFTRGEKKAEL